MRTCLVVLLMALLCCASCTRPERQPGRERVLFVGNSLIYVGNAPAVLSALAAANGGPLDSDMIVKGGATLAERAADGSVARALAEQRYTTLVLQERGGDLMCAFGPASCEQSRQALRELVRLARARGVKVVLLGTYQAHPQSSLRIVEAESSAAAQAGIAYVEISETLQHLRKRAPDLAWFAPDGQHPGKDLALLNAMRIHQTLRGALPAPAALTVNAPIYGVSSGLDGMRRASDAPPPRVDTPMQTQYTADTLRLLSSGIAH